MLLINIHQFQIILAQSVIIAALEDEVENIRSILSFESEDILGLGCAKNFCEGGQVDTEGDVTIATIGGETFGLEHHGDQGNVGVVHSLESEAGVITIEIAVLDQIFDSVDDLIT